MRSLRIQLSGCTNRAQTLCDVVLAWDERRRRNDWSGPSLNEILIAALQHERRLARRSVTLRRGRRTRA